jgi:hypothetical protein
VCTAFCDTDADCAASGGICAIQLSDGTPMGSIPGVTLCSGTCNPITNAGCGVASTGCEYGKELTGQMRVFTFCAATGTGGKNASCTTNFDCLPTFGCVNNGAADVCLQYCDVSNTGACGGLGCAPLQDSNMQPIVIGATQLGVCT